MFLISGVISTCQLGAGSFRALSPSYSCDSDDFSVLALISSNYFSFFLFLP